MRETIAKLVRPAPIFSITENGETVHKYFEQDKGTEGVVVVDGTAPVGILMRESFYQRIGGQFGYSIYMKRDIARIMKSDVVRVDISCDMARLGFIAMNRSKANLYDHIIVFDNNEYAGIISIIEFMIEMSKTKEREIELLNRQQQILQQANEAEKLHRMEIEEKNASIRNLLDNAGQGFLSFDRDLIISAEHSKECNEIFGFSIGNEHFLNILKNFISDDIIGIMQDAFEKVFKEKNKTRNKIYLSILPQEITIRNKYIKIEYKVIYNQAEKAIMIILTDITEKKALELKNEEEKNKVRLIIRAIGCQAEINQAIDDLIDFFMNGIFQLLNSGMDKKIILQNIYRMVHTMKGDFALHSLHQTSRQLHVLEDALTEMMNKIENVSLDDIRKLADVIDCEGLLDSDVKTISEALGHEYFANEDKHTVSKNRLMEIDREIRRVFKDDDQALMLQVLESLFYPNIKDIISNYNDYTKSVAEKLGKSIKDFRISGNDIYINRNMYSQFTKSLVHVFRNIVDHGIEEPDDRIVSGKPEHGEITCHIEKYEDRFVLNIADDGKGIDIGIIRIKALEKGIYNENELKNFSEEKILETIFLDDFSTKQTVDMLSGRGVGLAAVRSAVEDIGGTVKVGTEKGRFTNFQFVVPIYR